MRLMFFLRILFFNFFYIIGSVFFLEACYRSVLVIRTCSVNCDWNHLIKTTEYYAENLEIGITQFDPVLGYTPKPNFFSKEMPGWNLGEVSIDQEGLRRNGNVLNFNSEVKILAVGDSFTFGFQVNDEETWPSCVERTLSVSVRNGGVFGYGAAQSALRAEILSRDKRYDVLVLSILVGHGFSRDQLFFRSGFSKPAVITLGNKIQFSQPIPLSEFKYNQTTLLSAIGWLRNYSFVANDIFDYLDITPAAPRMSQRHLSAASIPEIIKFTLENFAAIDGGHKTLLLLYTESDAHLLTRSSQMELALILSEANKMGLKVIDSLEYLKKYPASMVWFGHNTRLGNQLVCDAVVSGLTSDSHVSKVKKSALPP